MRYVKIHDFRVRTDQVKSYSPIMQGNRFGITVSYMDSNMLYTFNSEEKRNEVLNYLDDTFCI